MAQCTALACPRLANMDLDNRALALTFSSSLATRDTSGNTWCNYCYKHRELMDYGKAHHWPAIRAMALDGYYYAIAEGQENWFQSIAGSRQDVIDAYYAECIGEQEQAS